MTQAYVREKPIWQANIADTVTDERGELMGHITRVVVDPLWPLTHIKIILSDGSAISAPRDFNINVLEIA